MTDGARGLETFKPRAAHLYILIYSVPIYIWNLLERIMNYIYTILIILKEKIIYIMSIDINTCYIYCEDIYMECTGRYTLKGARTHKSYPFHTAMEHNRYYN